MFQYTYPGDVDFNMPILVGNVDFNIPIFVDNVCFNTPIFGDVGFNIPILVGDVGFNTPIFVGDIWFQYIYPCCWYRFLVFSSIKVVTLEHVKQLPYVMMGQYECNWIVYE